MSISNVHREFYTHGMPMLKIYKKYTQNFVRRSTSFGALAPQSECVDVSKLFFPMLTSKVVMTATIFITPPNFGNDRHVKFLAVALHSHLNNGPDCCHRFVERPFMAEKKTPLNNYSLRGKKCSNT